MTDTQRALLLVALLAVVIAVLAFATSTRTEIPQPDPVKWDEIPVDTCLDRCVKL